MLRRRSAWVLGVVLGGSACTDPEEPIANADSSTGATTSADASTGDDVSANISPTFAITVVTAESCRQATSLELVATLVDCVGFGPCTLPNPPPVFPGDRLACDDAGDPHTLTVAVDRKGVYRVELVTEHDDGAQTRLCYGADGAEHTAIEAQDLIDNPTITLEPLGGPCPSAS